MEFQPAGKFFTLNLHKFNKVGVLLIWTSNNSIYYFQEQRTYFFQKLVKNISGIKLQRVCTTSSADSVGLTNTGN